MAGLLQLVLDEKITPDQLVKWLTHKNDEDIPQILPEHETARTDFVPFFLNHLRDQAFHLLQTTRSATPTPSKSPSSVHKIINISGKNKVNNARSADRERSSSNRVQLFGCSPLDNTPCKGGQSPGFTLDSITESPGFGGTPHANSNPRKPKYSDPMKRYFNNDRNPSPHMGRNQNHGSPFNTHSDSKSKQRASLGDFFKTPEGPQKGRSPAEPGSSGGRGNKHSGRKGNRRDSNENWRKDGIAPVFSLASMDDFPSLDQKPESPQAGTRLSNHETRNLLEKQTQGGSTPEEYKRTNAYNKKKQMNKLNTDQNNKPHRIAPTLLQSAPNEDRSTATSPFPDITKDENANQQKVPRRVSLTTLNAKNSKCQNNPIFTSSPVTEQKQTGPISPLCGSGFGNIDITSPRFDQAPARSNGKQTFSATRRLTEFELQAAMPTSSETDNSLEGSTSLSNPSMVTPRKGGEQIGENETSTNVTMSTPGKCTPSKFAAMTTPVRGALERLQSITEITKADSDEVTNEDKLELMAQVYSGCIENCMVPNLTVELYFIMQLLTVRNGDLAASPTGFQDPEEINYFVSVHNAVYFAVLMLNRQEQLLHLLDKGALGLLADNTRISEFSKNLKIKVDSLLQSYVQKKTGCVPVSPPTLFGVSFQIETDNRLNFPSDRAFQVFKKQRDIFYEIIRDWEEHHMTSGWSLSTNQGNKIHSLLNYRTELANYIHFARLFVSQLLQMCKSQHSSLNDGDDEQLSLLSHLKRSNPEKFKRLQERFIMPSSVGGPCPQMSFSGFQEFFRDFIMAASNHTFNQHLSITMATKIKELNEVEYRGPETFEGENVIDVEELEELWNSLQMLQLLGKFLGFLTFLPFQTPSILPKSVQPEYLAMRNQMPVPVDVRGSLKQAAEAGRLVLTVPWIVQFLSMMDSLAQQVDHFLHTCSHLLQILRLMQAEYLHSGSLSAGLIITTIGWLLEQPVFPDGAYFKEDITLPILNVSMNCLDQAGIVDHALLYHCCPYLGEIRLLLVDFMMGTRSSGTNIRKITPVSTELPTRPPLSQRQLQLQLEENFFHNQPGSLRRTVEFVAERVASNYIKNFRANMLPKLLADGFQGIKQKSNELQPVSGDARRYQDKMKLHILELSASLAKTGVQQAVQAASGFCESNAGKILYLILAKETSDHVKNMASKITCRLAKEKVVRWLESHITSGEFQQQLTAQYEKQDKQSAGGKEGTASASEKTCPALPANHDSTSLSPSKAVIMLRMLLRRLVLNEENVKATEICDTVRAVQYMLNHRQDLISGVYKTVTRLLTDLTYHLVFCLPDSWTDDVCKLCMALLTSDLCSFVSFDNIICPKNMQMISSTENKEASWGHCCALVSLILDQGLITFEKLIQGIERTKMDAHKQETGLLVVLEHAMNWLVIREENQTETLHKQKEQFPTQDELTKILSSLPDGHVTSNMQNNYVTAAMQKSHVTDAGPKSHVMCSVSQSHVIGATTSHVTGPEFSTLVTAKISENHVISSTPNSHVICDRRILHDATTGRHLANSGSDISDIILAEGINKIKMSSDSNTITKAEGEIMENPERIESKSDCDDKNNHKDVTTTSDKSVLQKVTGGKKSNEDKSLKNENQTMNFQSVHTNKSSNLLVNVDVIKQVASLLHNLQKSCSGMTADRTEKLNNTLKSFTQAVQEPSVPVLEDCAKSAIDAETVQKSKVKVL